MNEAPVSSVLPAATTTAVRRWAGDSKLWLESFLQSVPANVVSVVVMGSAVRDRGHRRSDLDLLVVYLGKRPHIRAPVEVDVRLADAANIHEDIRSGREILCWALKFGTAIYDPERFWDSLRQTWGGRIPLPSATEARERAKQALKRAEDMLNVGDESAADDLILAGVTQLVREQLIEHRIFPASRPELPNQLRLIDRDNQLAQLLDDLMFTDLHPSVAMSRLKGLRQ
jgi:predicted nucleotidyltransferase